jgi:hypothetical protein
MGLLDRFFKTRLAAEVAKVEERMIGVSESRALEKAKEIHQVWLDDLSKSNDAQPKTLLHDPFQLLESMGYKERPMMITYDTLRTMSERNPIIAAVINTRVNQIAAFSSPPKTKYDIGYSVEMRDDEAEPTIEDERRMKEIESMLENTGVTSLAPEERDDFDSFLRKLGRDSLTFDQSCFEIVDGRGGKPVAFYAVDASTIRLATTPKYMKDVRDFTLQDIGPEPQRSKDTRYVQVISGKVVNTYTEDEMSFGIRNPRTNIKQNGYGTAELEILVNTVTAHLWAEEYNRRFFSQGSAPKGIIHFEGNVPENQLLAFRRQWHAQVMGVFNAWRTPVIAAPAKLQYTNLQMSNRQMEYSNWIDYLIKLICAVYLIDPSEINFELRGGAQSQEGPLFESHSETKLKMSRDRGLRPFLKFIQSCINKDLIFRIDPRYEMRFTGLDAKTEEQMLELRIKEITNYKTIDEVRALDDLEALGPERGGDLIMNPSYITFMTQKAMAQQMGGGGGAMPGKEGMDFGEEGHGYEGIDFGAEEGIDFGNPNVEHPNKLDFGREEKGQI